MTRACGSDRTSVPWLGHLVRNVLVSQTLVEGLQPRACGRLGSCFIECVLGKADPCQFRPSEQSSLISCPAPCQEGNLLRAGIWGPQKAGEAVPCG